jgi:fructose-1,6-bisphosphatase/inositol monophosphatase family enzyme
MIAWPCREKIWDHAAGVVVFEEAGGKVTDGTGQKLDFGLGWYLDSIRGGIVAATPDVHAAVVEAVRELDDM